MMTSKRTLLTRTAASVFLRASAEDGTKFSGLGHNHFAGIGGYFFSSEGVWVAFDWTDGEEVFIEEFTSKEEAELYAKGEIALTKNQDLI